MDLKPKDVPSDLRKTPEGHSKAEPLVIISRAVEELTLDPKNPRKHEGKQVRQIAKSIQAFGFNVPILIDAQGQVIAGHGRLQAARLLGITEVPTITLDHLSEAQIRAFLIADNRLVENSTWDNNLLATQLKELSVLDLNFSLDATGFELPEIEMVIEGGAPNNRGKRCCANTRRDCMAKPQVSQKGDLWVLDEHRIYCGDCTDDLSFSSVMQGRQAQMVFACPPYNNSRMSEVIVAGCEIGCPESDFLTIFTRLPHYSADGALHYIGIHWSCSLELLAAARAVYSRFENLCVCLRDVRDQASLYKSQYDLVFVFTAGSTNTNSRCRERFGRGRTDVWRYPHKSSKSSKTGDSNLSTLDSNAKPIEMVADAILDSTARNDIVLDPFLGDGTTLIAAEQTGRICRGIEREPRRIDTCVRRWQSLTGHKAIQVATGRTFEELEEGTNDGTKPR